jgi:hypothetical protein
MNVGIEEENCDDRYKSRHSLEDFASQRLRDAGK